MARQSRAPTFLLTRPLPQSQRFATLLRARWPEMAVVISPLMAPEFLTPDVPQRDFAALILTSEAGAEAARRISATGQMLPQRAFCVGDRTAAAAKAAGFAMQSAAGDATDLLALIANHRPTGPLLFLRGVDSTGDIRNQLLLAGIETVSAIAYHQTSLPLTAEARHLMQGSAPVVLPLFSPRSARLAVAERPAQGALAPLWVAALSPAVAQVAVDLAPQHMRIAARPDQDAMLAAVAAVLMAGIGS